MKTKELTHNEIFLPVGTKVRVLIPFDFVIGMDNDGFTPNTIDNCKDAVDTAIDDPQFGEGGVEMVVQIEEPTEEIEF